MSHMLQRDNSATKSYRVEIAFILALFHCLKPLIGEGGEETGVPSEHPDEDATYHMPKSLNPIQGTNPQSSIGGRRLQRRAVS